MKTYVVMSRLRMDGQEDRTEMLGLIANVADYIRTNFPSVTIEIVQAMEHPEQPATDITSEVTQALGI